MVSIRTDELAGARRRRYSAGGGGGPVGRVAGPARDEPGAAYRDQARAVCVGWGRVGAVWCGLDTPRRARWRSPSPLLDRRLACSPSPLLGRRRGRSRWSSSRSGEGRARGGVSRPGESRVRGVGSRRGCVEWSRYASTCSLALAVAATRPADGALAVAAARPATGALAVAAARPAGGALAVAAARPAAAGCATRRGTNFCGPDHGKALT